MIGTTAFAWNYLTSVIIPNSVEYIDFGAFYDNNSLTSITIGSMVTLDPFSSASPGDQWEAFRDFYMNGGQQAGVYTWSDDDWTR